MTQGVGEQRVSAPTLDNEVAMRDHNSSLFLAESFADLCLNEVDCASCVLNGPRDVWTFVRMRSSYGVPEITSRSVSKI
jgi:hypothetical protein